MKNYLSQVGNLMQQEANAIIENSGKLDSNINKFIDILLSTSGHLVFMGLGKTGHIGVKACATFSSLGISSFFIHATEAIHGDLGMISQDDIVVILSNSGETKDTLEIIKPLKNLKVFLVGISKNPKSTLNTNCDLSISYLVKNEIDALNLAPTTSTIVLLSLLDSIACVVSKNKNFTKEDFHKFHPGGALGDSLTKKEHK